MGSALRGAARRAGKILPWALVTATVSIILRAIEERVGFIGQIVVSIIGLAWAVVTFLVLPAIVIEGVGVRDAFRKSTGLLRNTWGENLAGQAGLGLLGFLLILPGVAVGVLAALAGGVVMVAGIAAAGVWMALVAVTMAALSGIYQTALYHYAVDGQVPSNYFDNNVMQAAFRPRPGPKRPLRHSRLTPSRPQFLVERVELKTRRSNMRRNEGGALAPLVGGSAGGRVVTFSGRILAGGGGVADVRPATGWSHSGASLRMENTMTGHVTVLVVSLDRLDVLGQDVGDG